MGGSVVAGCGISSFRAVLPSLSSSEGGGVGCTWVWYPYLVLYHGQKCPPGAIRFSYLHSWAAVAPHRKP